VPRALHGAALLQNGQVLVAGGTNAEGTSNATAELYSPTTGSWKATGSMFTGQNSPATLLPNGKMLVAGGDTAELHAPSTGQWISTAPLYYGASTGISATLLTTATC
jgi:hypothetical protein